MKWLYGSKPDLAINFVNISATHIISVLLFIVFHRLFINHCVSSAFWYSFNKLFQRRTRYPYFSVSDLFKLIFIILISSIFLWLVFSFSFSSNTFRATICKFLHLAIFIHRLVYTFLFLCNFSIWVIVASFICTIISEDFFVGLRSSKEMHSKY